MEQSDLWGQNWNQPFLHQSKSDLGHFVAHKQGYPVCEGNNRSNSSA